MGEDAATRSAGYGPVGAKTPCERRVAQLRANFPPLISRRLGHYETNGLGIRMGRQQE